MQQLNMETEEAQLLRDAIAKYEGSLQSVVEGLAASPDEAELQEVRCSDMGTNRVSAAARRCHRSRCTPPPATASLLLPCAAQGTAGERAGRGPGHPGGTHGAARGATARGAAAPGGRWHPQQQRRASAPRRAVPGSSNARIHPRSKYAYEEPDFAALAELYPSLRPFLLRRTGGQQRRVRRRRPQQRRPQRCTAAAAGGAAAGVHRFHQPCCVPRADAGAAAP